jgi:hypothetical protein
MLKADEERCSLAFRPYGGARAASLLLDGLFCSLRESGNLRKAGKAGNSAAIPFYPEPEIPVGIGRCGHGDSPLPLCHGRR